MDETERRIGLNEAVFREVNERLQGINEAFGEVTDRIELVCECADPECVERITMTVSDYQRLRAESDLFVIRPGHAVPTDVESVVESGGDWEIVRKRPGAPARLAEATDRSS